MINVMLLDSQKIFRESLTYLLNSNELINVICDTNSFSESLEFIRVGNIDLVILDIDTDCDGMKLIQFIRNKSISIKILVLSSKKEIDSIVKSNELSVDGYLLKNTDSEELFKAIDIIFKGSKYIQPDLIPLINNYLINKDLDKDKIDLLTSRELQILQLIAVGDKNIDIAFKMNITERTVKNHLTHIFNKIDVKDRTQAAVFAIKNNIIEI